LPSAAWEWEGNWELEDNMKGVALDPGVSVPCLPKKFEVIFDE
jgi:hypothetical protein